MVGERILLWLFCLSSDDGTLDSLPLAFWHSTRISVLIITQKTKLVLAQMGVFIIAKSD